MGFYKNNLKNQAQMQIEGVSIDQLQIILDDQL